MHSFVVLSSSKTRSQTSEVSEGTCHSIHVYGMYSTQWKPKPNSTGSKLPRYYMLVNAVSGVGMEWHGYA